MAEKAVKIERLSGARVKVTTEDGGFINSGTVEANLLFAILEKLEDIRCGIIDVENAVERN